MDSGSPIVTRFAPSPTGHLHIGGARTALFCWAFARAQGGRFMIRIEDTDQARSSDESARGILEDLAWLGIEWDDGPTLEVEGKIIGEGSRDVGPYFQARRVALYNAHIEDLVKRGMAYAAFESAAELDEKRKVAVTAKKTYRYERPADITRGVFNSARWERACKGEPHVVRLAAPAEEIVVRDLVLGDVRIAPGELDDFVIRKADGFPTYHFAVVVDDELMGVTHVLRAQEHLANTPRHVALQRSLERLNPRAPFRTPAYGHMPLIFNMDGTKMSKRDKAKAARAALEAHLKDPSRTGEAFAAACGIEASHLEAFRAKENDSVEIAEAVARALSIELPEIEVADFRENGYLPEAIINFIGLLGWNPGLKTPDGKDLEHFDMAFIATNFSVERIGRTNAKFDRKKLLSFNADCIAALSDEEFIRRWAAWMAMRPDDAPLARRLTEALANGEAWTTWLAQALKPRSRTLRDAGRACAFLRRRDDDTTFDAAQVEKCLLADNGAGRDLLGAFARELEALDEWTPARLTAAVEAFVLARGLKGPGPIASCVRVALTGSSVSPGLGETMGVLGKAGTLARIETCLRTIG